MAAYLLQHPAMSALDGLPWHPILSKESHFFNGSLGRHAASSPAMYRSFFPTVVTRWWRECVRRTGGWWCFDACPVTACLPYAAKRIAAINPDAKLVFLVRDPVEAAFSAEIMLRNIGMPLDWSFMEDVMAADPRFADTPDDVRFWEEVEGLGVDDPLPADLPTRLYGRCSTVLRSAKFVERVKPFLEQFPKENIMFVEFGELCSHPQDVVHSVLKFVGADPAKFSFKPIELASGDRRGRRMHPAVRRKLQHYFAVHNQRLFGLLGRDFPWGVCEAGDEEEGGGTMVAIPVLHVKPPLAQGQVKLQTHLKDNKGMATARSTAVELLPQSAVGRKESLTRVVKRVVSITARV